MSNLKQDSEVVKSDDIIDMLVVDIATSLSAFDKINNTIAPDLDAAGELGFEDGIEGRNDRGAEYYPFHSHCWESYTDAYGRGLAARMELATLDVDMMKQMPELEFLACKLDELRAVNWRGNDTEPERRGDDFEDEWIGEDFSRNGWAY